MPSPSDHDARNTANSAAGSFPPTAAIVTAVAIVAAAWIAAGSLGLLAHPLRHALTWAALAVAMVAGCSKQKQTSIQWATLAGAAVLALIMTACTFSAANVLAVTLVAAVLARSHDGIHGRIVMIAALSTAVLGIFRLATTSIPTVWLAADAAGRMLGRMAGATAGEPLWVGATFGGLDFLVLMTALYAGWLVCTAQPRSARAIYAAVAILLGHLIYLTALAWSNRLLAALPDPVLPEITDVNRLGVWTWGNAARSLLPWNLPVLAGLIHAMIAVAMFRWATWLPVAEADATEETNLSKDPSPPAPLLASGARGKVGSKLARALPRFGPVVLAAAVPMLTVLALGESTLEEKRIVALKEGYANWTKPEHLDEAPEEEAPEEEAPEEEATEEKQHRKQANTQRPNAGEFGMLPWFVGSLHGDGLAEKGLDEADVLLLLHPDQPWSEEDLKQLRRFVVAGGSLLVAAEPTVHGRTSQGAFESTFNDLLGALGVAMYVRNDTAISAAPHWEHCLETTVHPATIGIGDRRNRFALLSTSSIDVRWPARPVLVGRFGFSDPGSDAAKTGAFQYDGGEKLGDLVLAAEQRLGRGRVVVLGDTSSLHNDFIANAYPFTGRMLCYLAGNIGNPQDWWRQGLGLLGIGALVGLLAWRPTAVRLAASAAALAVSMVCCAAISHAMCRVLPALGHDRLAYIDTSHLEAYSSDTWDDFGIGGLSRTLMRNDYLPLLLPELTAERLTGGGLLISIGPGREFSADERTAIRDFVESGGTFICTVGAEEARPSADMLADFNFHIPPSPVPPTSDLREPEPLGRVVHGYAGTRAWMHSYASWHVECSDPHGMKLLWWKDGSAALAGRAERVIIVSCRFGQGTVVVIGDTYMATNQNLESAVATFPDNVRFWRWLLSYVSDREEWTPPDPYSDGQPADGGKTPDGEEPP